MNKKKTITEMLTEVSPYDLESNLKDLQNKIQEWINKYGPDARLRWDRYYYEPYEHDPSPRFELKRDREETDEECEARLTKERDDKKSRDEYNRAEFERLKKLLGEK